MLTDPSIGWNAVTTPPATCESMAQDLLTRFGTASTVSLTGNSRTPPSGLPWSRPRLGSGSTAVRPRASLGSGGGPKAKVHLSAARCRHLTIVGGWQAAPVKPTVIAPTQAGPSACVLDSSGSESRALDGPPGPGMATIGRNSRNARVGSPSPTSIARLLTMRPCPADRFLCRITQRWFCGIRLTRGEDHDAPVMV